MSRVTALGKASNRDKIYEIDKLIKLKASKPAKNARESLVKSVVRIAWALEI